MPSELFLKVDPIELKNKLQKPKQLVLILKNI